MGLVKVLLVGILLIAEIILEGIIIRYEWKKRNLIGLLGAIVGFCGIIITILTLNFTWNDIGCIPKIFAIEYHKGPYNEGYYYGGWRDGMPQGRGTLTYDFFDDEKYYYFCDENEKYKALSYTGEFDKGYRSGEGIVIYEGGFKDEGTFYGVWVEGKKVFEGKHWLTNETFNGYREAEIYATSAEDGFYSWKSDWISVDQ